METILPSKMYYIYYLYRQENDGEHKLLDMLEYEEKLADENNDDHLQADQVNDFIKKYV